CARGTTVGMDYW
nr:immunoglobulin heavy chain junction region [Mus musculus]